MEKGSGIVNPSKYGYNIGDRIKTTCSGNGSTIGKRLGHYSAISNDEGVITGVDRKYTEILYDNGVFGYRYENHREQNFLIIQPKLISEPTYEIY